jgi:uroporphyrinogen III methyltransferase/synthase
MADTVRDGRSLAGRRVVVTRPVAQAAALTRRLEALGAEVVAVPTIRLEPPEDWRPLDEAIGRLGDFAWVLFTSGNGVEAFAARLAAAGLDPRALAGMRLGAIGPGTAEALAWTGRTPDLVPGEYRAEALLDALLARVRPGTAVLLVRAAEAREVLPRGLAAHGIPITVVPAYRTRPALDGGPALVQLLEAGRVDAITFTSSSTVHGLVALLPGRRRAELLAGVTLAAIGPVTAATLAEQGLAATIVAGEYTMAGLASALAEHFARRA